MRAQDVKEGYRGKRMLSRSEGAAYCGIGTTRFTEWARSIGAEKRFGSRVLFDKFVIDAALDALIKKGIDK